MQNFGTSSSKLSLSRAVAKVVLMVPIKAKARHQIGVLLVCRDVVRQAWILYVGSFHGCLHFAFVGFGSVNLSFRKKT